MSDHSASAEWRARLVAHLRGDGVVRSQPVAAAFLGVPRERFVPGFAAAEGLEAVYRDEVILAKRDARGTTLSTSSQPRVMALMLELLGVRPGERVLEIGTGTGYHAALLAELVGPGGHVVSIELDAELAARAEAALAGTGVQVVVGDGHVGWPPGGPYDAIVATAGAPSVPPAWFAQLRAGARVVVPLRFDDSLPLAQAVVAFGARSSDALVSYAATPAYFLPLRGAEGPGGDRPAPPALVAHDGLAGRELARLSGPGLAPLGPDGHARLLALAMTPGEAHEVRLHRPSDLLTQLCLCLPADRVVALGAARSSSVGAVALDGDGLVVASLARAGLRLERHGRPGDAVALMAGEIDRFRARAPEHGVAAVVGAYRRDPGGQHRRRYERDGVVLTVDPRP